MRENSSFKFQGAPSVDICIYILAHEIIFPGKLKEKITFVMNCVSFDLDADVSLLSMSRHVGVPN